ncbi:MAG: dihydroneopterin aldolase [Microscillaceae bacterium]|nr:dihydroneopterin aldolase [Microscillaceae bacterium]MDW8459821.1 dihydroneopterin aldolase [Cytophagales bacterium]
MLQTISIEGMEFYAYHGVMPQENQTGNRFTVDITVWTDFTLAAQTDTLEGTINYADLYQITAQAMQKPAKLLENLAYQIIQQIFERFPKAEKAKVTIYKHNPPVAGLARWSKITLKQKRSS